MFLLLRSWSSSFAKPDGAIKLEISPHLHDHLRCIAARIDAKIGASRRSGALSGVYCISQSQMFEFSPFRQKRKRMIDDETRFASS
jgi:hypothetical protein